MFFCVLVKLTSLEKKCCLLFNYHDLISKLYFTIQGKKTAVHLILFMFDKSIVRINFSDDSERTLNYIKLQISLE